MSSVYQVGFGAQPSDIDGAPGWYWTDQGTGETHGPYRCRESAEEAELKITRQQIDGMDSMAGGLHD